MTLYGYARVSIREPEDKNLDLQVERLVRAGCSMGNVRAEEASGAKDDRGGLLELLDLVVEGDTLVVTHIDRLSRGLTYGLQVIEGLHRAGVEFRSLSEDFDTSTPTGNTAPRVMGAVIMAVSAKASSPVSGTGQSSTLKAVSATYSGPGTGNGGMGTSTSTSTGKPRTCAN